MKRNAIVAAVLGLAVAFTGCSKDPLNDLSGEESRIYITNYDQTTNFSALTTFSISDTVTVINDGQVSKQATTTDLAFVNAIKQQMQSRGYTLVGRGANPDIGINVSRVYNTSTGVISYNNYWNDYAGFYDPYYWGYGGYNYFMPYSYATYSIREGALSIDMLDLKGANNNNIKVAWTGLIRGSAIFNSAPGPQIETLFQQSPYLKAN